MAEEIATVFAPLLFLSVSFKNLRSTRSESNTAIKMSTSFDMVRKFMGSSFQTGFTVLFLLLVRFSLSSIFPGPQTTTMTYGSELVMSPMGRFLALSTLTRSILLEALIESRSKLSMPASDLTSGLLKSIIGTCIPEGCPKRFMTTLSMNWSLMKQNPGREHRSRAGSSGLRRTATEASSVGRPHSEIETPATMGSTETMGRKRKRNTQYSCS
mmetsp:Transcript_24055/g.52499  ORF Transcript_24055/g.52499 Transcript_24055/m.52499 type:complete len:213 (+) Transcript_24055:1112-1750(+)